MSLTQDYKVVTFSGREAFACTRALRTRIEVMTTLQVEAITVSVAGLAQYSGEQVRDAEAALAVMSETPLRAMPVRGSALADEVQERVACTVAFPAPKRIQFDPAELDLVRQSLDDVVAQCEATMLGHAPRTNAHDEATAQRRIALCAILKVQAA